MNRYVGSPLGSPYCAASVCYAIQDKRFKTGLATALKRANSISAFDVIRGKASVQKGMIVIWQKGTTIYGHAGIASENWNGTSGKTFEGNTSPNDKGNQSNGDGFYEKRRKIQPTAYFRIRYFTPL